MPPSEAEESKLNTEGAKKMYTHFKEGKTVLKL